ncbi:acyl-CoA-binding protein [Marivirga tractuosa]|uniref:Acyl-coA-binding protein ACBP n=1 Tax=Marivirga tractuosa (strain ATCC 23168 / DSM 4126 / NBRC 15989 / NCIMB 1408 / VKM B-1430 / H-43) TaxID=643867 RepID=E4TT30_MARTH|nr:acyl-CoA-binding protein [Marivirga tractuosa]ADR20878.1 acyl-coA-binding protein ACBP [Marivirga tractuosa DSM 4126]BDD14671.1 acyl-CoA-binding protein [Marivirga tractuosa]
MSLQEDFKIAAERSKTDIKDRPSNEDLLKLYALFKQGEEGDVSGEKPGGFDFKAIAKYNAWEELKGKPSEEAMKEYIELVNKLANA